MARIIMTVSAFIVVVVSALQVSRSVAQNPVKWGQLPTGCTDLKASDVAGSGYYKTCQSDSGFTFDVSPPVATVSEDAFCNSTACLEVVRLLNNIDLGLACSVVPGLEDVKLETFEGRYACFGDAGNNRSNNVIVRPPKSTADSMSRGGVTEDESDAHSDAQGDETTAPGSAAVAQAKDGVSWKTAVGISSVGTILLVLAVGFVVVQYKKKKRRLTVSKPQSAFSEYDARLSTVPIIQELSTPQLSHYDEIPMMSSHRKPASTGVGTGIGSVFAGWDEELIAAVRIPFEKLEFGALVSRGGYGEVHRGSYRGSVVAIKTLLPDRRRDMRQIQNFVAEIKMMATMEHERIVQFIGVAWDSLEELSVVTEFLANGDLRSVLVGFEADRSHARGFDAVKVKIAMHVAHALTYLHTLQPLVVHRDLKSRNILLDEELNAKITDFGVSRERADQTMTAGVGSSLWMAPEVMIGERYDEKADIFSFGVVLGELDTHTLPYAHATESGTGRRLPDTAILQMVSLGKIRAAFTDEEHSDMATIGLRCVALNPSDRPTAGEVLHLIHQVSRQHLS